MNIDADGGTLVEAASLLERGVARGQLASNRSARLIKHFTELAEELQRADLEPSRRHSLADEIEVAWWALKRCPVDGVTRVAMEFLEVVATASKFQALAETTRAIAREAPAMWVVVGTELHPAAPDAANDGAESEGPGWPLDDIDREALRVAAPALLSQLRAALKEDTSLGERWLAYADYEPIEFAQFRFSAVHARLAAEITRHDWLRALTAWRRSPRSKRDGGEKWPELAGVLVRVGAWSCSETLASSAEHLTQQWKKWKQWRAESAGNPLKGEWPDPP